MVWRYYSEKSGNLKLAFFTFLLLITSFQKVGCGGKSKYVCQAWIIQILSWMFESHALVLLFVTLFLLADVQTGQFCYLFWLEISSVQKIRRKVIMLEVKFRENLFQKNGLEMTLGIYEST